MKSWDQPHGPDYAIDEPEFMAQYGRALAEWGNVEHALAHLFAAFLRPASLQISRAAYLAVPGFRDKLTVLDAAAKAVFVVISPADRPALEKEWQSLFNAANRTSKNRNKIAHMHVWHGSRSGTGTFGAGHMAEVDKLPFNWEEREKLVVTSKTLTDYRQGFLALYERISNYRDDVSRALIRAQESQNKRS